MDSTSTTSNSSVSRRTKLGVLACVSTRATSATVRECVTSLACGASFKSVPKIVFSSLNLSRAAAPAAGDGVPEAVWTGVIDWRRFGTLVFAEGVTPCCWFPPGVEIGWSGLGLLFSGVDGAMAKMISCGLKASLSYLVKCFLGRVILLSKKTELWCRTPNIPLRSAARSSRSLVFTNASSQAAKCLASAATACCELPRATTVQSCRGSGATSRVSVVVSSRP